MIIDLNNARMFVGKAENFMFDYEPNNELLAHTPYMFVSTVKVTGNFTMQEDESIVVKITVRAPINWICDRCGDRFEKNLFCERTEIISPNPIEDSFSYSGSQVDIQSIVDETIVFNLPSKMLCSEGCKGVCPVCGKNLNYEKCECSNSKVGKNNPFASLKDKFN